MNIHDRVKRTKERKTMTVQDTIYPAKYYPIYQPYKTVGGWVVMFVEDRCHARNVDGGKIHAKRQNAYAKAKRLNETIGDGASHWFYAE